MTGPPPNRDSINRESAILFRSSGFEITTVPVGSFAVARIRGRSEEGLPQLIQALSTSTGHIALDFSNATGIDLPLVQALCEWADQHRALGYAVALVDPPSRLISLLNLLGEAQLMPVVAAEAELEALAAQQNNAKSVRLSKVTEMIRKQLAKNVLWRYTDSERNWLCPFCGTFPLGLRLGSPSAPEESVLARMSIHLRVRCPGFNRPDPSYLSTSSLEQEVARADSAKDETARIRTDTLRREIGQMETAARRKESMEKDIRGAAERQQILLPSPPRDFRGVEVSILYKPSEAISGDFYDFVKTRTGAYAFVIGDVSGHGVHAGILMGVAKKVLHIRLAEMDTPAAAICKANADLYEDLKLRSFVTAFVAVFDPADSSWTMFRAGHNPAMWCSPKGEPGVHSVEPPGLMLGVAVGERFSAGLTPARIVSQPGDTVMIYSDGVVEAMNSADEQFGEERLKEVLGRRATRGPADVIKRLESGLDDFVKGRPFEDDATVVAIRVTGAAP